MALAGAALMYASLNTTWFEHDVTSLTQSRDDPFYGVVDSIVPVSGWASFTYLDAMLVTTAVLTVIVVLFDWFAPRPDGRASFTGLGVIASGMVSYAMIWRPDYAPGIEPDVGVGAWIGLVGAVLIAWGGRVDPVEPVRTYRRHRIGAAALR